MAKTEEMMNNISDLYGLNWDRYFKLQILDNFIDEKNLSDELKEYVEKEAQQEIDFMEH